MSRDEAPKGDTALPAPDKQVIRLPDGRELTFYRFPEPPPAPGAAPAKKER